MSASWCSCRYRRVVCARVARSTMCGGVVEWPHKPLGSCTQIRAKRGGRSTRNAKFTSAPAAKRCRYRMRAPARCHPSLPPWHHPPTIQTLLASSMGPGCLRESLPPSSPFADKAHFPCCGMGWIITDNGNTAGGLTRAAHHTIPVFQPGFLRR